VKDYIREAKKIYRDWYNLSQELEGLSFHFESKQFILIEINLKAAFHINMSSRYKTKSKTSKKSILSKDVRVMIKFGWNGQRVPVNNKMTIKSTLMAVIESIQTQIPSVIFEGFGMELVAKNPDMTKEPTLLHMRNCIQRSDWNTATLEDVGVEAGSGSALLTLNLGGVDVPNATIVSSSKNVDGAEMNTKMPAKKSKESSFRITPAPSVEIEQHPPLSTPIVASDDITKNIPVQSKALTCEESLTKLITSHFDSDSQDCIKTLMKVIDNIIHKPGQPKTRSIRLQNQAFWNKVGSKKGGGEFSIKSLFFYYFMYTKVDTFVNLDKTFNP